MNKSQIIGAIIFTVACSVSIAAEDNNEAQSKKDNSETLAAISGKVSDELYRNGFSDKVMEEIKGKMAFLPNEDRVKVIDQLGSKIVNERAKTKSTTPLSSMNKAEYDQKSHRVKIDYTLNDSFSKGIRTLGEMAERFTLLKAENKKTVCGSKDTSTINEMGVVFNHRYFYQNGMEVVTFLTEAGACSQKS